MLSVCLDGWKKKRAVEVDAVWQQRQQQLEVSETVYCVCQEATDVDWYTF
jgi:hypothetical protein